MAATKGKVSVTIKMALIRLLEERAHYLGSNKSALLEQALEEWFDRQLAEDAKAAAKVTFSDLPTEDEWLAVQSEI